MIQHIRERGEALKPILLYGTFYQVRDHAEGREWTTEYRSLTQAQAAIDRSGLKHNIGISEYFRDHQGVVHFRGNK